MDLLSRISWKKTLVLGSTSALALFILFQTQVHVGSFADAIRTTDLDYFWLAFATMIPTVFLSALRWYWLLRAAGFSVSLKKIITIIASNLSLGVLPGRLGDLARSYPLRAVVPVAESVGTIILEKIIDVSVLLLYSALGLFLIGQRYGAILALVGACSAVPVVWFIHTLFKNVTRFEKIHRAFNILFKIKTRKAYFLYTYLSSVANWMLSMLQVFWLYRAVHISIDITSVFAFLPLSIFVGLLPFTLAGIGTRDASLIYFFAPYASTGQTLAVGILYGFQSYWVPALLGLPLLYFFFRRE